MLVLVAILALAGCGGSSPHRAAGSFTNPVFRSDFPDPFVLRAGDTYYAYGTNGDNFNIQLLRSPDLVSWQRAGDALPELPPWAIPGNVWAPEVLRVQNGDYVLFYAAYGVHQTKQCLGRAVARSPAGPFRDRSRTPFLCQVAEGGSIDPDPFRDSDGSLYLLWKNDGNCCGLSTYLYSQRLSPDGARLVGRRARRLTADPWQWEGPLVEAPTLWKEHGRYYLFFSAGAYDTSGYAVGYATCAGPLGPCKASRRNPILKSACRAAGPGGQSIVRDRAGQEWLVYHAWPAGRIGGSGPGRLLWLDRLVWHGGVPVVRGPTCRPQPTPH
jgi:beta-xylosidase